MSIPESEKIKRRIEQKKQLTYRTEVELSWAGLGWFVRKVRYLPNALTANKSLVLILKKKKFA